MFLDSIVAIVARAASPCERRDCEHPSPRRDPTGRTGAGMPELRGGEIIQLVLSESESESEVRYSQH